ncbi:MAG: UDP-N-acetylmuramate dehydrogenase [Deltaproteobacteria bacterium]|nr:UDP-N-acetylmuramate dehydrogenase [Deltaproteobacteria bacterium]
MIRLEAPCLRDLTTLRLGGRARTLYRLQSEADLGSLAELFTSERPLPMILGGGSNILALDGDHDVDLLRLEWTVGPEIVALEEDFVLVKVGGGNHLGALVRWCRDQALSGLEGLVGIPGTVGGALAGNAGAHGQDMGQILHLARFWHPAVGPVEVPRAFLDFSYRSMVWPESPGWHLATEAVLRLRPRSKEEVARKTWECLDAKRTTQPLEAWTAGCVFKNPSDIPAGFLLDRAGWRGRSLGGMRFSPKHANFLENTGQGSSTEAFCLIDEAREDIQRRHDIALQLELRVFPWP